MAFQDDQKMINFAEKATHVKNAGVPPSIFHFRQRVQWTQAKRAHLATKRINQNNCLLM